MQTLEISATVFGLLQGILVLLNKRSNWIFYIAQIFCLIGFSYCNKLYGDVISNSFYLCLGIYGWILWKDENKTIITQCSKKERLLYVLIAILSTKSLFLFLKNTEDPLPLMDSFTTSSSFVATYYMVRKKLDSWVIWFVNDICYVLQYSHLQKQAYYLMSLNIIWSIMAIISFFNWHKIMKGYTK